LLNREIVEPVMVVKPLNRQIVKSVSGNADNSFTPSLFH